jgi:hypothetical protein
VNSASKFGGSLSVILKAPNDAKSEQDESPNDR